MLATVHSATLHGLEGRVVRVEVDVAPGLPGFSIVRTRLRRVLPIAEGFAAIESRLRAAGRPLTAQERDDAVQGSLLGFPGDFEQGRSIAWEYASVFLHSRPDDWLLRWSERVAGVTLSSLELTASRRCSPEGRVVVIAGDRAAVAPSLEALGHPLIVHDREGKVLQRQPVRRP